MEETKGIKRDEKKDTLSLPQPNPTENIFNDLKKINSKDIENIQKLIKRCKEFIHALEIIEPQSELIKPEKSYLKTIEKISNLITNIRRKYYKQSKLNRFKKLIDIKNYKNE